MKQLFNRIATITMIGMAGCSQGTPGGSGTTDVSAKKPVLGQTENTFHLSVPFMSTTLQQGETIDAEVGIERAQNFSDDVALVFTNLPKGVSVSPGEAMIKHGDTKSSVRLTATDEAAIGDYKVQVTGHPSTGGDAAVEFRISVTAKDTFTVGLPLLSTSLKQGESKTVSMTISRDKKFQDEVTLKFGELPVGVSFEPAAPVIKQGDSEATITLTATDDAALGDFTISVTGQPSQETSHGADVSKDFKLSVIEKQQ
jgi:uncharacterized membrane protein